MREALHTFGLQCLLLHKRCMPKPNVTLVHKRVTYSSEFGTNQVLAETCSTTFIMSLRRNGAECCNTLNMQQGATTVFCLFFFPPLILEEVVHPRALPSPPSAFLLLKAQGKRHHRCTRGKRQNTHDYVFKHKVGEKMKSLAGLTGLCLWLTEAAPWCSRSQALSFHHRTQMHDPRESGKFKF